jgi:hypothetical protein
MSPAAEHLRARIGAAPTQGLGKRRFGAELKRSVVEYAFAREDERVLHPRDHRGARPLRRAPWQVAMP